MVIESVKNKNFPIFMKIIALPNFGVSVEILSWIQKLGIRKNLWSPNDLNVQNGQGRSKNHIFQFNGIGTMQVEYKVFFWIILWWDSMKPTSSEIYWNILKTLKIRIL